MKYLKTIFALLAVAFIVTGCSSRKDASKSNFKRVINDYYAKHCVVAFPGVFSFPAVKETKGSSAYGIEKLNALAGAGMLTVKDTVIQKVVSFDGATKGVPAKVFDISEKGKKYYSEAYTDKLYVGNMTNLIKGFCAGTLNVDEVVGFTAPSNNLGGFTLSTVNVKCSPKKVHTWAKGESIRETFPDVESKLVKSHTDTHVLILMDKGWVHFNEYQAQQQ